MVKWSMSGSGRAESLKQSIDPKIAGLVILAIVVIVGAVVFFKTMGPGAAVPPSEDISGVSQQYQNDLQNRGGGNGGGTSEADMRNQPMNSR